MSIFEGGGSVTFYSRVHRKNIKAVVEFKGQNAYIVQYQDVRYSLQNTQILRAV